MENWEGYYSECAEQWTAWVECLRTCVGNLFTVNTIKYRVYVSRLYFTYMSSEVTAFIICINNSGIFTFMWIKCRLFYGYRTLTSFTGFNSSFFIATSCYWLLKFRIMVNKLKFYGDKKLRLFWRVYGAWIDQKNY